MATAWTCIRPKGDAFCILHQGQKLVLQCEDCPGSLVCHMCIPLHPRHIFKELSHGVTEKVDSLKSFVQQTESQTIPQLVREIQEAEQMLKDNTKLYEKEIVKVKAYGDLLKHYVNIQTVQKISVLESTSKENFKILTRFKETLEKLRKDLEEITKECKTAIRSDSDILVFDTEADISKKKEIQIPENPGLGDTLFEPSGDPKALIDKAFSKVSASKGVLSMCDIEFFISSICPLSEERAWIFGDNTFGFEMIDEYGNRKAKLKCDDKIWRACTGPFTEDNSYYCCSESHKIFKLKCVYEEFSYEELFKSDMKPYSIGHTGTNVIVGMIGKVCLYEEDGRLIRTYRSSIDYPGVTAYNINVCKITKKIALSCGQDGVIMLNKHLEEMFIYTGERTRSSGSRTKFMSFSSVFDQKGNLLVGNVNDKVIHVLDGSTAQLLRTIDVEGMSEVYALGLKKGVMWVGCRRPRNVIRIKYQENV